MAFTTKEAIQYSFTVVSEGCDLDVTKCSVDVSAENVVVMVAKSDECCITWQHFKAGTSLVDVKVQFVYLQNKISNLQDTIIMRILVHGLQ